MTEQVTFASDEWIARLYETARADQELLDSIKTLEGPITIVLRPEPKLLPAGLFVWIDGGLGRIDAVTRLQRVDEKPAKFVLTADYRVWEKISQGKQGIIKAILFGKIRVEGDKLLLLKQVRTADALGRILSELPTRFP